ncbi:MAG TPA: hypothetical protein VNS46_17245 [Nocardioides sp.]|nr:hypothetical protein [Nocardioides sp.]
MRTPELGRSTGRRPSPFALAFLVVALLLGTTGGAVAGGLITGAKIKDGTVTGVDIKNGSLTAVDIKDEPRVYGASAGYGTSGYIDNFTADAFTPIVSKSFTVPKGFLFITAHVYVEGDIDFSSDGLLAYAIKLDGNATTGHTKLDTSSTNFSDAGSITIVLPVAAGAHTMSLVARDDASASFIRERSISAVWSPTGSKSGGVFNARTGHPRLGNR